MRKSLNYIASTCSLDDLVGKYTPSGSDDDLYNQAFEADIIDRYTGDEKFIIQKLFDGYSFYKISKDFNFTLNEVYKFKKKFMKDFSYLLDKKKAEDFLKKNEQSFDVLVDSIQDVTSHLSLAEFAKLYINPYNPEAKYKHWDSVPLQDVYFNYWQTHSKTCILAPREHLKTTSILEYILKVIFERQYPIEINYYHLNKRIATEKLQILRRMIEQNDVLVELLGIKEAKKDTQDYIELYDGTILQSMGWDVGVVGKHPHIIVLDDVIDRKVIYSDDRNKKAINKFYSDIYPMITKAGKDKKIIIIGTAQRADDLYHKLPDDFKMIVMQAIVDEAKQQVLEPKLFNWDDLMKVKADISKEQGERFWLKEYMNKPFDAMGLIIKGDWIKYYNDTVLNRVIEIKNQKTTRYIDTLEIYQAWDLSVGKDIEKGDWTVGVTVGVDRATGNVYVLDIFRARVDFSSRIKAMVSYADKWKPLSVGIEDVAFQYDTIQKARQSMMYPVKSIKALKNKIERFSVQLSPHFENGKIYIKEDMQQLKQELLSLPVGEYDDQADALTYAVNMAVTKQNTPQILSI